MKSEVSIDKDNWVSVTLEAETVKEAAQLVRLGLNKSNTDNNWVQAGEETIRFYISVMPTPGRRLAENQQAYVRFQK